jgi:hypothetical protein
LLLRLPFNAFYPFILIADNSYSEKSTLIFLPKQIFIIFEKSGKQYQKGKAVAGAEMMNHRGGKKLKSPLTGSGS